MSERIHSTATRSRRALLTAAAGAAAAAAASAIAPAATRAADPNDVVKDTENVSTALTTIAQGTTDTSSFAAYGNGIGVGVLGTTDSTPLAGVVGLAGDASGSAYAQQPFALDTGIYGFAAQTAVSSGVLGEGPIGVYGYGDFGFRADGGTVGILATARPQGTAVHAHAGDGDVPAIATSVALRGTVTSNTQTGVQAYGRVKFPNRSGRVTFSAGQSSKAVSVSGMTSGNYAFAVLNASRPGIYVRAVVPAAGKITIYLSKAVSSSTSVAWLVLG